MQATTLQEQWLAPRIHYGLRITRSEASNPELWNYLALSLIPMLLEGGHMTKMINTTQIELKVLKYHRFLEKTILFLKALKTPNSKIMMDGRDDKTKDSTTKMLE